MAVPIPVWRGVVGQDGKLHLESRRLFARYIARFKGQGVQVVVRRLQRPKSQSQLGFLFGVVYPVIAEEFGYADHEIEALHDAIMRHLVGLRPQPNPLQLRASLAAMTHEEVSDYIDDVRHWALTEHGIVTPDSARAEPARERRPRVA